MREVLPEDLIEKYERFKAAKALDGNPLVRYCTKPGCGSLIKAPNDQATRLVCPECATEICFKCRNTWHGEIVTCEEAMSK